MSTYLVVAGNLVDKQTGVSKQIVPQEQIGRPKAVMLGNLTAGRTFEHNGKTYKKLDVACPKGGVAVLEVSGKVGRPSKPILPEWLMVIV